MFGLTIQFLFVGSAIGLHAHEYSVMSYNVENLFDPEDDPDRNDEEFTPDGAKHWTEEKLERKMANLAKVVLSVKNEGREACPDILGLVEVENRAVLQLWKQKYLKECKYQEVLIPDHSPDMRGIQTAVMSKFPRIGEMIPIKVYDGGRFILQASFNVNGSPLTVFINHWKSRVQTPGSKDDGSAKRIMNAKVLRQAMLRIHEDIPEMDMIAMGDFNDEPENDSFMKYLGVTANGQRVIEEPEKFLLWETSYEVLRSKQFMEPEYPIEDPFYGEISKDRFFKMLRSSLFFGKEKVFNQLDHIVMPYTLFDSNGLRYKPESFEVIRHPDFRYHDFIPVNFNPLREPEERNGASDHFPLLVRLEDATKDFE